MPRRVKTPAQPASPLRRLKLAQEALRLAALARAEREAARTERRQSDHRAKIARRDALARTEARIAAGGFGQRPRTPEEDTVRTTIADGYAAKMGW